MKLFRSIFYTLVAVSSLLLAPTALARSKYMTYVENGGATVLSGLSGAKIKAQQTCAGAAINIYEAGTTTPALIYSDAAGTVKPFSFNVPADGYIEFWTDLSSFKMMVSGGGCGTFTRDDVPVVSGSVSSLTRDLSDYVTGGSGTPESPYTGWASGFTTLASSGTGTISVSQATAPTTVTGTNTLFLTELSPGQYIKVGSNFGRVSAIASNTQATVETWPGATQSGQAFSIWTPQTMDVCGRFTIATTVVAAYPGLHIRGCGSKSAFIEFTVAGIGLDLRIPDANGYLTEGVDITGITFVGSSATTPELVSVQNLTRFYWEDVRLTKSGGSYGLFIDNAVIATMVNVRYSENEIAQTVEPSVAAIRCTPCYETDWYTISVEGMQSATGFQLTGSMNDFYGGAIEGNLINFEILDIGNSTGSTLNSLYSVDLERLGHTTYSARITGADYTLLSNVNANDDVEFYQSGTQTPRLNRIDGGQYATITVGALVQHTSITNMRHLSGSLVDSGTATRRCGNLNPSSVIDNPCDITGRLQVVQQATLTTTVTASTGLDTGSATVSNNCCDSSMLISLAPTGSPASSGTVTVTFAQSFPASRRPSIVATLYATGANPWHADAKAPRISNVTLDGSSNTVSFVVEWNNTVALSAGTTYIISVIVVGRK